MISVVDQYRCAFIVTYGPYDSVHGCVGVRAGIRECGIRLFM